MPWSQEVLSLQEAILTAIVLLASLLESHRIALLWLLRKDRVQQRPTELIRHAGGGAVLTRFP